MQAVEEPAGWDMPTGQAQPFNGVLHQTLGMPAPAVMPPPPMQPGAPAPIYAARTRMAAAGMAPPAAPKMAAPVAGSLSRAQPPREQAKKREIQLESKPSFDVGESAPADDFESESEAEAGVGPDAYLAKLGLLARELETRARAGADPNAIRMLRQRLTEWIEDLRSVGGHDALAAAVDKHVKRLTAALAQGTTLATEAITVATELAKLAAGSPPPSPKPSRLAFWK